MRMRPVGVASFAPFGTHEDTLPDRHRLEKLVSERDPVACIGGLRHAAELGEQFSLPCVIVEKDAPGIVGQLDDACAARFPQFCSQNVFVGLLTVEVD